MSAFGIREVCHCVFTPKKAGMSPFVIDTAKMSTIEAASTTVYAQGGAGNSRLIAWEGEKTLTFTIEDALITLESFRALTGAAGTGNEFKIYPTSFAGYYSITAYTLFRKQEDGKDYLATITIPNAKLQTTLNLSMAPTGDPSSFTFTFDAFPDPNQNNLLFDLNLETGEFTGNLSDRTNATATTTVYINGVAKTTDADAPILEVDASNKIKLGAQGSTVDTTITLGTGEILTNLNTDLTAGKSAPLAKGSTSRWYTI